MKRKAKPKITKKVCVFCLTISPWKNESNPRKKKSVYVCVFFSSFFSSFEEIDQFTLEDYVSMDH